MGNPVSPGTVALSFKLSIGKVGIISAPMYTNEAIATLPIKEPESLKADYLYWALRYVNLLEETDDAVMGKTLNKAKLARIQIPVPPIETQRSIVETLDQADALLAKRRRTIPLLDELAQSVFLDMFGDPLVNPRSWPLRAMGELFRAKPCYGTMIPGSKDLGEWFCLRVANIQDWELDLQDEKFVDLDPSDVDRHSVVDGDMIPLP